MKNITNTERMLRHFWLEERKNYIAYVGNYTTKELLAYEEAWRFHEALDLTVWRLQVRVL